MSRQKHTHWDGNGSVEKPYRKVYADKPKPPCDHYAVRYMGYIRCRDCHAVWNLGLKGPIWVEADA